MKATIFRKCFCFSSIRNLKLAFQVVLNGFNCNLEFIIRKLIDLVLVPQIKKSMKSKICRKYKKQCICVLSHQKCKQFFRYYLETGTRRRVVVLLLASERKLWSSKLYRNTAGIRQEEHSEFKVLCCSNTKSGSKASV